MRKYFHIKGLYGYILKTFIPLFLMTFAICLFLVLMQFLWKYVEDMVGKGLIDYFIRKSFIAYRLDIHFYHLFCQYGIFILFNHLIV